MNSSMDKVVNLWYAFLVINILTIPLSPVAGGLISRDVYIYIMGIKLGFLAWLFSRWLKARREINELSHG